tara:strand:- start:3901 stop:4317 length:417 start_codon:yes stop_codon:yes gene_type:complete
MDMHNVTYSTVATDVASVGTSFDAAKRHAHQIKIDHVNTDAKFRGWVYAIHIHLTSISSATALTVSLSLDAAGDYKVMPDTSADISLGITTASTGCIGIRFDLPVFQILAAHNDYLYLHFKTDAGTVTVAQSCITWRR